MHQSLLVKIQRRMGARALGVALAVVFLAVAVCAPAQSKLYPTPSSVATYWGQEPIYQYLATSGPYNGQYMVDDPTTAGSTYGAIRMNGTTWADSLEVSAGVYTWDTLDRYHRTFPNTDLLYTWYRTPAWAQPNLQTKGQTLAPEYLYSSGPCQTPLSGSAEDCYVKSFWTAFMQHVCPSGPSSCWVTSFELWNEFNASQFWTDSNQNLAKMGSDAAAIIRAYCNNCKISAGSTSGGGAGSDANTGYTDPNGQSGLAYYDTDQGNSSNLGVLDYWYADVGASGMPDFVSWHPYTIWYDYSYTSGELGPGDPAPFPEFIYSGDGTGADNNDGTGSDLHQASRECPSTVTTEYSVDYKYSSGTSEYGRCGDAILTQIGKMQSMAAAHHMSGKPIWATEGGYSDEFAIQGTVTGMSGLTARDFLRTNWMARWLILLSANGVARAYPYAYDTDGTDTGNGITYQQSNGCWMPQYIPKQVSTETTFLCNEKASSFTDGWASNYDSLSAGALTPNGNAWLQVETWLNGASTPVCTAGTDHGYNIYSCTVTRSNPSGYHATIYWVTDWNKSDSSFVPTPPSGKHFTQYQWLDDPGGYIGYTDGNVRSISGEPIMFEGIN